MSLSSSNKNSETRGKKGPNLPWWVELLFVQIGLPDKWLPEILKTKNNTKKYLVDNYRKGIYLIIIFLFLGYLYPSYKYFKLQNKCIEDKVNNLKSSQLELTENVTIQAARYCNGTST